jgi:hypothetical protein
MDRFRRPTPLNLLLAGLVFGFALEGWIALVDKSTFRVSYALVRGAAFAAIALAVGLLRRRRSSAGMESQTGSKPKP